MILCGFYVFLYCFCMIYIVFIWFYMILYDFGGCDRNGSSENFGHSSKNHTKSCKIIKNHTKSYEKHIKSYKKHDMKKRDIGQNSAAHFPRKLGHIFGSNRITSGGNRSILPKEIQRGTLEIRDFHISFYMIFIWFYVFLFDFTWFLYDFIRFLYDFVLFLYDLI